MAVDIGEIEGNGIDGANHATKLGVRYPNWALTNAPMGKATKLGVNFDGSQTGVS